MDALFRSDLTRSLLRNTVMYRDWRAHGSVGNTGSAFSPPNRRRESSAPHTESALVAGTTIRRGLNRSDGPRGALQRGRRGPDRLGDNPLAPSVALSRQRLVRRSARSRPLSGEGGSIWQACLQKKQISSRSLAPPVERPRLSPGGPKLWMGRESYPREPATPSPRAARAPWSWTLPIRDYQYRIAGRGARGTRTGVSLRRSSPRRGRDPARPR